MEVEISDGDGDTLKEAARKVKVSNKILDCKLQVDKDFFFCKSPHTLIVLDFQERHQSLALMEKLNNEKQNKSELEVRLIYLFWSKWVVLNGIEDAPHSE